MSNPPAALSPDIAKTAAQLNGFAANGTISNETSTKLWMALQPTGGQPRDPKAELEAMVVSGQLTGGGFERLMSGMGNVNSLAAKAGAEALHDLARDKRLPEDFLKQYAGASLNDPGRINAIVAGNPFAAMGGRHGVPADGSTLDLQKQYAGAMLDAISATSADKGPNRLRLDNMRVETGRFIAAQHSPEFTGAVLAHQSKASVEALVGATLAAQSSPRPYWQNETKPGTDLLSQVAALPASADRAAMDAHVWQGAMAYLSANGDASRKLTMDDGPGGNGLRDSLLATFDRGSARIIGENITGGHMADAGTIANSTVQELYAFQQLGFGAPFRANLAERYATSSARAFETLVEDAARPRDAAAAKELSAKYGSSDVGSHDGPAMLAQAAGTIKGLSVKVAQDVAAEIQRDPGDYEHRHGVGAGENAWHVIAELSAAGMGAVGGFLKGGPGEAIDKLKDVMDGQTKDQDGKTAADGLRQSLGNAGNLPDYFRTHDVPSHLPQTLAGSYGAGMAAVQNFKPGYDSSNVMSLGDR